MQEESKAKEQELVSRLINNDEYAFAELYFLYRNRLIAFARKFLKSQELAEDIFQDVFTVIWQNRHFLNPNASFSSYLFTITRNRILNLMRDSSLQQQIQEYIISHAIDFDSQADKEIILNEYRELLEKALLNLTKRQREIFEMSRYEGLSHKEIAAKLNISVYTVQEHISSALRILQNYLKRYSSNSFFISLFLILVNKS